MARYVLRRILLALPALWLVLTLVFLMIHIVPGDPVEQLLGKGAAPGRVVQLRHARGQLFDAPHMVVFHALAVVIAALFFNLLGDAWRDWLDPRTPTQLAVANLSR
jgi:ABC-type dipeptide/oligopeptide/nickel transport system permease component